MKLLLTKNRRQSLRPDALASLFASKARVAVLRVLALDPTRAYYQRQLEAVTGLPIRAVQRELERLSGIGLLYRHTEGNRVYYQMDTACPLFPELRSLILKAASPVEVLRGTLAVDPAVRLLFLTGPEDRALMVTKEGQSAVLTATDTIAIETITSAAFLEALGARADFLAPFLEAGTDQLGRRDDLIWRRIEAAGYNVNKGVGVA